MYFIEIGIICCTNVQVQLIYNSRRTILSIEFGFASVVSPTEVDLLLTSQVVILITDHRDLLQIVITDLKRLSLEGESAVSR